MTTTEHSVEIEQSVRRALFRARWHAQGRYEAYRDVLENGKGTEAITADITELEELLTDPQNVHGSWGMNTSVRRCAEGHWAGLKEILSILTGGEVDHEPVYPTPK